MTAQPFEYGMLEGRDVFVFATGPSLRGIPTGRLDGSCCWGVGELVLWDEMPRMDFYSFYRVEGYRRYADLVSGDCVKLLYYDDVKYTMGDGPPDGVRHIPAQIDVTLQDGWVGSVDQLDWVGYSPATSLSAAVQPAMWTRPRNIFLLGFDFSRTGYIYPGFEDFDRSYSWEPEEFDLNEGSGAMGEFRRSMVGLNILKTQCEKLGIGLVNLTEGTGDFVLPKAHLEDVV